MRNVSHFDDVHNALSMNWQDLGCVDLYCLVGSNRTSFTQPSAKAREDMIYPEEKKTKRGVDK